jgi:putative transposase
MRRMLFKTIHDLAIMLDRMCSGREVVPTAGVVDSQSVKAPAADEQGYDANKKIKGASGTLPSIPMAGCWR